MPIWMQILVLPLGLVAAFGIIVMIVRLLAEFNVVWTYVPEGRAKIITLNGRFERVVMSYNGYRFRRDYELTREEANNPRYIEGELRGETLEEIRQRIEPHPWDIIPDLTGHTMSRGRFPFLSGIYWVGLPPFAEVFRHTFRWTSFEQTDESPDRVPKAREEEMDFALVQDDVYYVAIKSAETSGSTERLPVDVQILLTARIVNPFKAYSRVQRWLELVTDQTDARIRAYIGEHRYEHLIDDPETAAMNILEKIADLTDEFLGRFGVRVDKVQILSIDPPPDLRELTLARYKADQEGEALVITARKKAEARAIEANAEEDYIRKTDGVLAELGAEALRAHAIKNSNLTTAVTIGGSELRKLL